MYPWAMGQNLICFSFLDIEWEKLYIFGICVTNKVVAQRQVAIRAKFLAL